VDLTDVVVQQLREKAKLLRSIADQLAAGEHLRSAVTRARDPAVWTGSPQTAFCAWLDQLDRWVRERLATGVGKVADEIERHAGDLDDAQRKVNNAIPGVGCPPPGRRVGWTPTRPPEFVMQADHREGAVFMAPTEMEGLVTILGQAKDAYYATGRQVEEALAPPRYVVTMGSGPAARSPIEAQVAAQLAPEDHIPPDAAEACGWSALLPEALGIQLERALLDVADRSRKWALAMAADAASDSGGLLGGLAGLGAALAKAQAITVQTSEEVSRQQGAADAARFAAVALPKGGHCPDHDDVARLLEEVQAKAVNNPAYAAGFTAAVGAMDYKFPEGSRGNGFEYFRRKVGVCGTGGGEHKQRWDDLITPVGEVFASATHDASFDMEMAKGMLKRGRADFVFLGGPLRTDVALVVADHWIKAKDWRQKYPLPLSIADGLKVLSANPEAAHIYALGHTELLTKGTNPDLLNTESYGYPDTAPLAADVLRIGLVEYPAHLADAARSEGDTPSGQAARAAAEEVQRKAEAAMAAAVDAVGKGARLGPEGCRVLAGFLASHIGDVASSLDTNISLPSLRGEHLAADKDSIEAAVKQIMKDPDARKVLLCGANSALNAWTMNSARFVGDDLAGHPEMRLRDILAGLSAVPGVADTGKQLAEFYGVMATQVAANYKDQREAAAEIAGVMGFFVSRMLGGAATAVGTVVGGGVGGIVVAVGADELSDMAGSFINDAQQRLPQTKDAKALKDAFMNIVTDQMEQMTAVSLWADGRIRERLLAGDPPVPPAGPLPITDPPLENSPGTLRIPASDEEPARSLFFRWFEHEGGVGLKMAAEAVVQNSGMLASFDHEILEGMFRGG
jgi:hypothetical protein